MQAKGGGGYIWGYYNRKPDIFLHEDGPITGEAYKRISKIRYSLFYPSSQLI